MNAQQPIEPLLDSYEAARILGVHQGTLVTWRSRKKGPAYIKVGNRVRYRMEDLRQWIEARCIR
jgi:excisionase family DNA binding protein